MLNSQYSSYAGGARAQSTRIPFIYSSIQTTRAHLVVVIQRLSCVRLFATPWTHQYARISCPSLCPEVCSNSCLLRQWWHPTVSFSVAPSSPALNLSQHRVFSNESVLCIRWPKYWSFSFSISPSNEYSGMTSFRIY